MLEFKILKRSAKSLARVGIIATPHGEIETPAFVPVATRATVRTLESDEIARAGSQILICNTYHLRLAPTEKIVRRAGGLHDFMRWEKPLMSDSGGFQVFSLGFGSDHGMGKMLRGRSRSAIEEGAQPRSLRIEEGGVRFRSPLDGKELFLGPKESIRIQEALGADIMFAFDECPSPIATRRYLASSLERTHRWAAASLAARRTDQALFGIVQGGKHADMRIESAKVVGAMDFDGFGVGGEFGYDKRSTRAILARVAEHLPEKKPRHILGVGHPEDFAIVAGAGGDTFDCIAPTHYARHGTLFTSRGRMDITKRRYLTDQRPVDAKCSCDVCAQYSRAYLSHLLRARELTGMKLATMHNLHFFNALAAQIRRRIKNGDL